MLCIVQVVVSLPAVMPAPAVPVSRASGGDRNGVPAVPAVAAGVVPVFAVVQAVAGRGAGSGSDRRFFSKKIQNCLKLLET